MHGGKQSGDDRMTSSLTSADDSQLIGQSGSRADEDDKAGRWWCEGMLRCRPRWLVWKWAMSGSGNGE